MYSAKIKWLLVFQGKHSSEPCLAQYFICGLSFSVGHRMTEHDCCTEWWTCHIERLSSKSQEITCQCQVTHPNVTFTLWFEAKLGAQQSAIAHLDPITECEQM